MASDEVSDDRIEAWLSMPKRVTNPRARVKTLERQEQRDYTVMSETTEERFALFVRRSTRLSSSFSVGLRVLRGEESITLMRCNGPAHAHRNHLEDETFGLECHIHVATARYINAGRRDEGFAERSSHYSTVDEALAYMLERCNISGLVLDPPKKKAQADPDPSPQDSLF